MAIFLRMGKMVNSSKFLSRSLVLLAVCLLSQSAKAKYAGSEASTYVFVPDQSKIVQTGGIAGVHWTYSIEGQFELTVDPNAGTASFAHVDANATDDSPFKRTLDLNHVFNMTELIGTVVDDATIEFAGKASDGSAVRIAVTLQGDLAYLIGQTTPPPNSADFFIFDLDAVAQRKYGGGSGTADDPYQIWTAEQMNAIGAEPNDWDKHFKLMADIDLSEYTGDEFNIIGERYYESGWVERPFTGIFDGNDHTISNFTYDSNGVNNIGLFGYIDGEHAEVRRLGLVNPNVDAGTGINVGSLVGVLIEGKISGCYVEGGTVCGRSPVGGLLGSNGSNGVSKYGKVSNSYSTNTVSGDDKVGGLVGWNLRSGRVSNCCSMGTVSGADNVGGLVGWNQFSGEIVNCYATGDVTGSENVGGLVGYNHYRSPDTGEIRNCYSAGRVIGIKHVGGLIGLNYRAVEFSFWDIEASGQIASAGGTGKTTAEMKTASTFLDAGWDFVNVWGIGENQTYPYLRKYSAADINQDASVDFLDLAVLAENWLATK